MKYFQSFLVDRYLKTASLSSFENSFVLSCLGLLGKGSISDLRPEAAGGLRMLQALACYNIQVIPTAGVPRVNVHHAQPEV